MSPSRAISGDRDVVADERVALLYRRGALALIATLVNAGILGWFLHGQLPPWWLGIWGAALVLIVGARALLLLAYRRNPGRWGARFWETTFVVGAVANGLVWGAGGTAFLSADLVSSVAVLFVVGGMVAGASTSTSTSLPAYAGFSVSALLPITIRLLGSGDSLRVVMGITGLVFGVAMALVAAQGGQALIEAVRLRVRNEEMAEELSRRSRDRAGRLQALLDHSGVVTIVADPETGRILDASRGIADLFDRTEEELIGRTFYSVIPLETVASISDWRALTVAARREPSSFRTSWSGGDRVRYLELTATIRTVEEAEYALLVLRDVTAQRELEGQLAQSSLLASLGTLSAGVAHEINNPLAYIIGNLRYIRGRLSHLDQETAGAIQEPLDDAIAGAQRIARIVEDLAATARSVHDGPAAVDPRSAIETCLRVMENELRHRAVVELDCEPTPPVRAEALQLDQILLNLLLNAAEAIPEGRASTERITVRLRYQADAGQVVIAVRDSGRGIEPDLIERVFQPFFTTRPGAGTGLGLSVCHAIVTGLGGSIQVESRAREGSEFVVRLPAADTAALATEQPDSSPMTATVQRFRLLVLDDDRSVARSLARLLSPHEVIVQTRADVALEHLQRDSDFDAILCDIMMPEMTGVEFHGLVQGLDPLLARRIVFITGGTFTDRTQRLLEALPNPCLKKPFDLGAIERAIGEVVMLCRSRDRADSQTA